MNENGDAVGRFVLMVSDERIAAATEERRRQSWRFAAALGALMALAWFLIAGIIARPLDRLAAQIRALAQGDHDASIPYTRRADQIGAMARAVNVFRAAVAERAVAKRRQESLAGSFERNILEFMRDVDGQARRLADAAKTVATALGADSAVATTAARCAGASTTSRNRSTPFARARARPPSMRETPPMSPAAPSISCAKPTPPWARSTKRRATCARS